MPRGKKATRIKRPKGIPYIHYRKDAQCWEIRGTHPVTGKRFRESQGAGADEEVALARRLEIEIEWKDERLYGPRRVVTFGDTLDHYLENKHGGSLRRYFPAIREEFGSTRVSDLTTKSIKDWANKKWPNCSAVTKNKQSFEPMITVLHYASKDQICDPPHFRKFEGQSELVRAAPEEWIKVFLQRSRRLKLKALVLLLTTTGARCIDARRLLWSDICPERQEVIFRKTKNGLDRRVVVSSLLMDMLMELRRDCLEIGPFPYNRTDSVNKEIQRECVRLGMDSYSSHKVGRHAFAERILRSGASLKEVKEAGGWKSYGVFEERYGHLETGKIDVLVLEQADAFADKLHLGNK